MAFSSVGGARAVPQQRGAVNAAKLSVATTIVSTQSTALAVTEALLPAAQCDTRQPHPPDICKIGAFTIAPAEGLVAAGSTVSLCATFCAAEAGTAASRYVRIICADTNSSQSKTVMGDVRPQSESHIQPYEPAHFEQTYRLSGKSSSKTVLTVERSRGTLPNTGIYKKI